MERTLKTTKLKKVSMEKSTPTQPSPCPKKKEKKKEGLSPFALSFAINPFSNLFMGHVDHFQNHFRLCHRWGEIYLYAKSAFSIHLGVQLRG